MSLSAGSNIWQLQARGDTQGIIQALDSTDPQVRSRAIIALGMMKATEALPKLRLMRSEETNTQRRLMLEQTIATLEKLVVIEQPETPEGETSPQNTVEVLVKKIYSDKEDEAIQGIMSLGKLGDRTVVEHLIILFRNPSKSASLRLACAESLIMLESAPASASLLAALRKPQSQTRRNAAAILGQLKADWAVEPLIKAMQTDPNSLVRRTAIAALRHIRTPEALQALKALSTGELNAADSLLG